MSQQVGVDDPREPSTIQLIRWLRSVTAPVHPPLLVSALLRVLTQLLDIALFATAGWSLATAVTGAYPGATLLGVPLAGFVLLPVFALSRAVTHYLEQFTGHYVAFKALELLRGHAFSQLWRRAPQVLLRGGSRPAGSASPLHSGSLLTGLTRDIDRIEVVYAHTFAPVVSAVVVPAIALTVTGYSFGFVVIAVPLVCLVVSVFVVPLVGFHKSRVATEETLASRAELTVDVSDSVHGVSEVLTYGRQRQRARVVRDRGERVLVSSLQAARVRAARRSCNLLLSLVSVVSVVLVSVAAAISPVWAVALALGATRVFEAPRGIESAVGYLDHSFSAAGRLWLLCHLPETVSDGQKTLELASAPRLEWREVTYRYPGVPQGAPAVLKNFSACAEAGATTVFAGASGSGKSTAAQLLLRFDDPQSGNILINGVSVSDYTLDSLRSQVVLVSQQTRVLTGSIAENLRLGASKASDAELWRALEVAEFAHEVSTMPAGLHTPVGAGGSELSGGQLQRVALARALLMKPKVLVLDEFTAHLSAKMDKKIRKNLGSLEDTTVIEISHRLEHLGSGERIYTVEHGQAKGEGIE